MTEHEQSVQYINEYIARARAAQAEFEKMTQEQVDLAVKTIGKVVYEMRSIWQSWLWKRPAWAMLKIRSLRTNKRLVLFGTT